MNWINLNITVLDSEEFLGADPTGRATWLCLLRYCCGQENGGRIEGAKTWADRKWQQIVRVMKKEVNAECDLWRWDGDDLIVAFYPDEKEAEVQQKRETARLNGTKGGRPKKPTPVPTPVTQEKPTSVISEKAEGERELEGEGERERKDTPPPLSTFPAQPPRQRPREGVPINPMNDLKARINGLKPEWSKPAHWSSSEDHGLFGGVSSQMAELTDGDWKLLKAYLNAPHRQGEGFWVPVNRSKFVETFADVFSHAVRWGNKTGQAQAPKPPTAEGGIWR